MVSPTMINNSSIESVNIDKGRYPEVPTNETFEIEDLIGPKSENRSRGSLEMFEIAKVICRDAREFEQNADHD
jgi:hypothetical protein